jgi:hypothetical protein
MRKLEFIGRLLVLVVLLPHADSLCQEVAETTVISDVLDTDRPGASANDCGTCVIPKTPTFCQSLFNLPTTVCASTSPTIVGDVVDCRKDGDFSWAQNLWIRKIRPSNPGEAGQECVSYRPKSCVIATNCKLYCKYIGVDPDGMNVYVPSCKKGETVKQAGWAIERVPEASYCEGPSVLPSVKLNATTLSPGL